PIYRSFISPLASISTGRDPPVLHLMDLITCGTVRVSLQCRFDSGYKASVPDLPSSCDRGATGSGQVRQGVAATCHQERIPPEKQAESLVAPGRFLEDRDQLGARRDVEKPEPGDQTGLCRPGQARHVAEIDDLPPAARRRQRGAPVRDHRKAVGKHNLVKSL